MEAAPFDLNALAPGSSIFVPSLRVWGVLADAVYQAEHNKIPVSYRVTVVDGKYGVLFTRLRGVGGGLRNEDTKDKGY